MNTFFILHFKVNDPVSSGSGGNENGNGTGNNGWGLIPYPLIPVYPYYPGNGKF